MRGKFRPRAVRAAVVACCAAAVGAALAPSAAGSCAPATAKQLRASAIVIFDGTAMNGPTVNGELLSPATFQVERYIKGSGPRSIRVTTATARASAPASYVSSSVGIRPAPGERWRIYGVGFRRDVLLTSDCDGSEQLDVLTGADLRLREAAPAHESGGGSPARAVVGGGAAVILALAGALYAVRRRKIRSTS